MAMPAKTSAFVGSGVATVGGEAPVEQCPREKFCIERDSPLCDSKMWKMLDNYYKKMAIEAWAHDYVPSFVTSNSRLCRSYAKIIINFLQDWFKRPEADPTKPVTILEIGGGHGRFTFLLLRAMKRYQRFFESLGLPERPFLFVFSDVAEANVAFCIKHPALKEFVDMQWLDFAIFDGNKGKEISLVVKAKPLVNGAAPVVAICNYVLDSLLTDAWRVTPGASDSEFERALVSIYSPIEEEQLDAPDIMPRMTLGWKWRGVHLDAACDTSSLQGIEYLQKDSIIKQVLLQYRKLNKQLSFVLPIGAFALFQNLLHIGGGRLFCLVGDKGYPTADEFEGVRDPHIAIHGSVSFMLNIHAVRTYFECMGGFSHATPYRDTFQVTGINANLTSAPKASTYFCLHCVSAMWKPRNPSEVAESCDACACESSLQASGSVASADLDGVPAHSSTYINIASCCKVEGDFEAGLKYCDKALEINPHYPQAIQMQRTLHMCINPVKVALIGCGYWSLLSQGSAVLDVYKPYHKSLVWHAVENNRQEEAFAKAAVKLAALGPVSSVSFKCVTDTALKPRFSVAPYDIKHHMALDLLRCLAAVRELTGLHLSSISATAVGDHAPCSSHSCLQEDVAETDKLKDTRQRPEFARLSGWLTLADANAQAGNGVLGSFVICHCVGDNSLTYQFNCLQGNMRLTKASSCKHGWVLGTPWRVKRIFYRIVTSYLELLSLDSSLSHANVTGSSIDALRNQKVLCTVNFPGWRIEVSNENPSGSNSFAVQSIGHQNCHDAFAEDLYDKIYSVDKPVSPASVKDGPAMVDVSINGALADSAVIEGILASIQLGSAALRAQ
ncbi:hypothetical protein Emag_003928 [Eimeria magna]